MANVQMEFPGTWEEYEKEYGFNDSKEVYTNNARLIPSFRVKQWLDHLPSVQPTDKENLVVEDCISRAELLKAVDTWDRFGCDADTKLVPIKDCYVPYIHYDDVVKAIKGMPSIPPKTGHWIVYEDCEGKTRRCVCDQCRHETGDYTWKNPNFCENCGAKMEGENIS